MTCSRRAIWRIADARGCPVAVGRTGQTAGAAGSADFAAMARATVCAIVDVHLGVGQLAFDGYGGKASGCSAPNDGYVGYLCCHIEKEEAIMIN